MDYILNTELLRQAKQWILENPQHLDMNIGIGSSPCGCGTVACVAGTVCMLGAGISIQEILSSEDPWKSWEEQVYPLSEWKSKYHDGRWYPVKDKAMELLGITDEVAADVLFYLPSWEDKYLSSGYREAETPQGRTLIVAEYIERFITLVEEGAIAI